MTKPNKKIAHPSSFLEENGLLFEINRHILHPFGISLELLPEDEINDSGRFAIVDKRESKEGPTYNVPEYMEQVEKADRFIREEGMQMVRKRNEELGFTIQQTPDAYVKRNGVTIRWEAEQGVIDFQVPLHWLQRTVSEWHNEPLELFLKSYDEAQAANLYREAQRQGTIISKDTDLLQ